MRRGVATFGIIDHLAGEHAAIFVEGDGDGIADLGLVGGELEFEARFHFPRGEGSGGLDGKKARKFFRGVKGGADGGSGRGGVGIARREGVSGRGGGAQSGEGGETKGFHGSKGNAAIRWAF